MLYSFILQAAFSDPPVSSPLEKGDQVPRRRRYKTPVDEKQIGRRLQEIRKRRGLTQVELAEKLGINQSLVSQYERGALRLHGALVAAFAKALRVSADQILGLEKTDRDGLPKDRRFLRRLQKIETLSRRDKQALLKNLDMFLRGAGVA
jgi:transcriptional regulator with XRE-family HTH domain